MSHAVLDALGRRFSSALRIDEPLAMHTSFRIGGPADFFISARTREDIVDAISVAEVAGLSWLVLGRGSNVLIDERGFRGLVIRNDASTFTVDRETGMVRCDSGARMPSVGAQTAKAGLAGFEWAVGIPGSVGGGILMNAGAHGGCVADVLVSSEVLDHGARLDLPASAFEHAYRTSRLQRERWVVVLGAEFQLRPCPPAEALARVQAYRRHRQETQPTDPGAGSIFRNPPDNSSGALIDRAGLKGTRRGGALISPKHGNFIVNVDHATSADVLALIELARETVVRQFGITLQPEVEFIGPTGRVSLEEARV
jgi:UDP-N-acetylmuramate dehydrogenase